MLVKTKGIVLHHFKYKDSSIIVKIYTEELGIQSYIVNGVRSKNAKTKIGLFQPLTLLDLVVYFNEKRSLHRISEVKCGYPYSAIPFNFKKSAIAIFITEVLSKTLKEEESNKDLFSFLSNVFIFLDSTPNDYENTHIYFLLRFSSFLGINPITGEEMNQQIIDAVASKTSIFLNEEEHRFLNTLLKSSVDDKITSNHVIRNNVLNYILNFYRIHIDQLGEMKSLEVLREVMQ